MDRLSVVTGIDKYNDEAYMNNKAGEQQNRGSQRKSKSITPSPATKRRKSNLNNNQMNLNNSMFATMQPNKVITGGNLHAHKKSTLSDMNGNQLLRDAIDDP